MEMVVFQMCCPVIINAALSRFQSTLICREATDAVIAHFKSVNPPGAPAPLYLEATSMLSL